MDPSGLILAFQASGVDLPVDYERQNDKADPGGWGNINYRKGFVHLTPSRMAVRHYASREIANGSVYEVRPLGPLTFNPAWLRAAI